MQGGEKQGGAAHAVDVRDATFRLDLPEGSALRLDRTLSTSTASRYARCQAQSASLASSSEEARRQSPDHVK